MLDKKTRLNAVIREHIVNRALETSGVDAEDKQLIEDRAAFAEKVRQICLTKSGFTDKELRKQYELTQNSVSDPKLNQWMRASVSTNVDSFDANINGQHRRMFMNGATESWKDTHVVSKRPSDGGVLLPYARFDIADNDLADELNELDRRQKANNEKRKQINATVTAAVKQVSTIGKLLEAWPQAEELLPTEWQEAKKANSLALRAEDLNALCGIPSEESEK